MDEDRIIAEITTYRFDGPAQGISEQSSWHVALWLSGDIGSASFGLQNNSAIPWPGVGLVSLAPAGLPISWQSDGGEMRSLVCRFPPHRFAELTGLDPEDRDFDFRRLLRIGNARGAPLRATMKLLAKELLAPSRNSEKMVEALCIQAAIHVGRLLEEVRTSRDVVHGGLAPWQLRRLQDAAEGLATGQSDLESVARNCGIGARHFSRAFRQSTGLTLADYLAEVRLTMALRELGETTRPIADIAADLGFAHASGLSIAFRRATGESPRAYRRRRGGRVAQAQAA